MHKISLETHSPFVLLEGKTYQEPFSFCTILQTKWDNCRKPCKNLRQNSVWYFLQINARLHLGHIRTLEVSNPFKCGTKVMLAFFNGTNRQQGEIVCWGEWGGGSGVIFVLFLAIGSPWILLSDNWTVVCWCWFTVAFPGLAQRNYDKGRETIKSFCMHSVGRLCLTNVNYFRVDYFTIWQWRSERAWCRKRLWWSRDVRFNLKADVRLMRIVQKSSYWIWNYWRVRERFEEEREEQSSGR